MASFIYLSLWENNNDKTKKQENLTTLSLLRTILLPNWVYFLVLFTFSEKQSKKTHQNQTEKANPTKQLQVCKHNPVSQENTWSLKPKQNRK